MFDIKRVMGTCLISGLFMSASSQTIPLQIKKEIGQSNPASLSTANEKRSNNSEEPVHTISDLKEQPPILKNLNSVPRIPSAQAPVPISAPVLSVLPPGLLSAVGAAKPPSRHFELVGLYLGPETFRAEVLIGGMSHFYQIGDQLNQDWVIDAIDAKGIQVSRCKAKAIKCEMKRVSFLAGVEP
jgi:hypothetical protein